MSSAESDHRRTAVMRVITRLNIGGPAIQASSLPAALEPYGFTTTLIHGSLGPGEGDMSDLIPPGTDAVFIPSLRREIRPLDDLRAFAAIYREMRRRRPAIVHTHMAKAGLLGRAAAVLYNLTRGAHPRARIVHTYHGHVLDGYFGAATTAVIVTIERLLARHSDALVAIAPQIRRELIEEHRIGTADRYHLIPLGFALAPFAAIDEAARQAARDALGIPAGVPVVATVGRLTAIKQQAWLLEIARRLADVTPNLVVLIAGDGELRGDLERQAAALGLSSHVRFLGWRRDLATIYAATDVFVLTSRNEGTPVAMIEAMAAGVPGVATDVGGVSTVIADTSVGVLVALGDTDGFVAGVRRLLEAPDRATIGARARAHVLETFDSRRLAADIDRLYRTLLARP